MKKGGKTIVKLFYCLTVFFIANIIFIQITHASPGHLVINEVYYDTVGADGEEEWIELYNPMNFDIDISGYKLLSQKGAGEEEFIVPSGEIKQKSFLTIARSAEGFKNLYGFEPDLDNMSITLSNDGDYLVLKDKEGVEIDVVSWEKGTYGLMISYPKVAKGHSIERVLLGTDSDDCSKDFEDRIIPTPGAEYQEAIEEPENDILSIEKVRDEENGEEVTTSGIVTVPPGTLSSQYFYIQDETSGLQVYCYYKTFPILTIGDKISVSGTLSETNNERRLKMSSAEKIVIQNHTEPVTPVEIAISDIGEKNEGTLVKTAGIVTETSGDTFYVGDGKSEIKVVINKSTGIEKPKMKKGDQVEVSGIVSQYKDEYRILPIEQDNVKIIASDDLLPRAGIGEFIYFIFSLFSIISWNIYQVAKMKLTILRRKSLQRQNLAM